MVCAESLDEDLVEEEDRVCFSPPDVVLLPLPALFKQLLSMEGVALLLFMLFAATTRSSMFKLTMVGTKLVGV